ncbi:unnamed protein product, partial [Closterium sp. NIES-53]
MAEPAELSPGPAAKPAAGFAAGPVGEAVAAQPAETATGPKAMSVASMPPSVVAELLWPSLRSFSLGLLVDALGFSIGLAVSLVTGCRLLDKRRSFEVSTPQVRRVLAVTDEDHLDRLRGSLPGWVKDPGLEPARWLNHVIARFWHVLNPALSKIFVEKLWPAICRHKRFPDNLLQIEDFSFGSFPLVVEYVK